MRILLKIFISYNKNKINLHCRPSTQLLFTCGGRGEPVARQMGPGAGRPAHFLQDAGLAAGRGAEHFYC